MEHFPLPYTAMFDQRRDPQGIHVEKVTSATVFMIFATSSQWIGWKSSPETIDFPMFFPANSPLDQSIDSSIILNHPLEGKAVQIPATQTWIQSYHSYETHPFYGTKYVEHNPSPQTI